MKAELRQETYEKLRLRQFFLVRYIDESGVSGTGIVATGIELPDGQCVMQWLSALKSTAIYESAQVLIAIHGHGGNSVLTWLQ